MTDTATPNLPSRDLAASARFYAGLGFTERWRDGGWMVMERGTMTLEFFPYAELDPHKSWFSCCFRIDDLDAFYAVCKTAGIPEGCRGQPRLHPAELVSGTRVAALIDPDGTLIRLIEN